MASGSGDQVRLSVAAAARRLGVAPSTLRTWDRRYGLGPTSRREGEHRYYGGADLVRLERMRHLLLRGVSAGEAARAVAAGSGTGGAGEPPFPAPAPVDEPAPSGTAGGLAGRRLWEAVERLDADRVVALLGRAVAEEGTAGAWEGLLRPALAALGAQWAAEGTCIAEEHLLTECATGVFHRVIRQEPADDSRPVLLMAAPGETHVLPLHALAAALTERRTLTRVLGAATPHDAGVAAARRLHPAAVVVWAQTAATADAQVFAALPRIRGGCRWAAAGPGWEGTALPPRVSPLGSLGQALSLLAGPR